jgi:ABC-2 type transport system permease protein
MLQRPIYLVMTLLLPAVCYAFFASLMRDGMPVQLPIAVVDRDNSALSRNMVRQIGASPQLRIVSHLGSYTEGRDAMQSGDIFGFIILPANMQADAMSGRRPEAAFYANNSYLIAGSLVMRDLTFITALSSASLNAGIRAGHGQSPMEIAADVQPVALDFHAPGNPWANYSIYLSTILSHGLLQILILLATIYAVGVEMKKGTAGQWLNTVHGSMIRALVGKLLPYTLLFSLMVTAGNTLFFKYLHFPCNGSFFAVQLAGILMVVACQATGIFIFSLLGDFRIALTIAGVFGVLGISFSGVTFPIEIMDAPLQASSWIFPIRYYFYVYQTVALHGVSAFQTLPSYLMLMAFVLFPFPFLWRLKQIVQSA